MSWDAADPSRPGRATSPNVADEPTWETVGAALWTVGLVPDLGGPDLVGRLPRNAACVRAVARPTRAVASVADRLTSAELEEGEARDRIARFLSRPDVDLSDAASWAAPLALLPATLTFDAWPLAERTTVEIDQRPARARSSRTTARCGRHAAAARRTPGDLPYVETGPDSPGSVTVAWRTDPAKTERRAPLAA